MRVKENRKVYTPRGLMIGEAVIVKGEPALRIKQSGKARYDVASLAYIEHQMHEILETKNK